MSVVTTMKVASTTDVKKLADAIAFDIREGHTVALEAMGASAVNQAIKAIAVARGPLMTQGTEIAFRPSFVELSELDRTLIKLEVFAR